MRRIFQFTIFALLSLILSSLPTRAASAPDGKAIYRRLCVECHGKNGEGVKGKYDIALEGDRTLERLARYIDKNMPEDHPEKCDAAESAAVAKYIYDAFYSIDARLRNNPPRIEMAHLTNRQLINSIADLIGRFDAANSEIGSEHGLKATYYNARNFDDSKKLYTRIDRSVNFDFGAGGPEQTTTNEFAIQWRGSLIAEETGFYDLILKTPIGARLWLNDDQEPIIDAWVSSAELVEHKISLRLIGGRAYPLRLDCFRYKDKKSSIALAWKPPHGPQQIIPPQNLRTKRTGSTFVIRTPFPADDSSFGFERGVAVSKAWDDATTSAALEVAAHVLQKLDRYSDSKPTDTNRLQKLAAFSEKFVTAAFRRPLTAEQKKIHLADQFKTAKNPEEAVKRIVLLALKSPRFLYLGLDRKNADDYEIASRLSYGLWDSMPDAALIQAAEKGELRNATAVKTQAKRMLGDQRARDKVSYILEHWLEMDRGDEMAKDAQLFPGFTPELITDLRTSLLLFLDHEVWSAESDYRKLLLADYMFVNDRLAKFYHLPLPASATTNTMGASHFSDPSRIPQDMGRTGASPVPLGASPSAITNEQNFAIRPNTVASTTTTNTTNSTANAPTTNTTTTEFVKIPLNPAERAGVITHPYLLAAFAYAKQSSPIHRGVFLTRHIVGRALKPPPVAVAFKDAEFAPNLTMREKISELTKPQNCQSCHSVINPLGFSLENFDAVGRFRQEDNGRPIDTLAEYLTQDGTAINLTGPRDIANYAANNEDAQRAFVERLFQQIVKQPPLAYGRATIPNLQKTFAASHCNIQTLLFEIATLSALQGNAAKEVVVR